MPPVCAATDFDVKCNSQLLPIPDLATWKCFIFYKIQLTDCVKPSLFVTLQWEWETVE